jgi:methyl coenzyme M reductase gamma subunit
MTVDEKQISFMNRYFVFQKLRDVNAEKIGKLVAHKTVDELELPLAEAEKEKETAPKKITKVQGEKVTISDEVIKIKIKRKKET